MTRSASSTSIPTRRATAGSSVRPTCRTREMNCTTSAGTPAVPASARTRPHPHMERRYLVVPGINSSRIHILDTKPDPRQPRIVKVIEAETLAQRTGYAAPHTVHCGPDGIFMSALGAPDGNGPGRHVPPRSETFDVRGPMGARSRTAGARLRHVVAPGARHDGHQHVGHAQHGEGRRQSRSCCSAGSTASNCTCGTCAGGASAGARSRRRAADGARTATGPRSDARLRVRRRRRVAEGSVLVGLVVVSRHEQEARNGSDGPGPSRK